MTKKFVLSPVAFTLGAMSVQPDRSLYLVVLNKMVERVFRSSHNLQTAFVHDLNTYTNSSSALISIAGNLQVPISCELRLNPGLPINVSYFADMADSFILGVLARHYNPLVQVSEVRQRVKLFWRFPVIETQFYQWIEELVQSGLVVSHDRTADTDQRFLSLPDDAYLLEDLLATS